jgi:hypothetical protein
MVEVVLITGFSFWLAAINHGAKHIDVNIIDGVFLGKIQESYGDARVDANPFIPARHSQKWDHFRIADWKHLVIGSSRTPQPSEWL